MTNVNWKILPYDPELSYRVVWRRLENGVEESCKDDALEYLAWVAEGNEAEELNPESI
jgi:hypothetical protein